ncbi:MAG: hypothetical protein QNJ75_07675 [Acidimicrobiia bacterium]|nr:hypothetical protein [Acidimicrobiia bacterium]
MTDSHRPDETGTGAREKGTEMSMKYLADKESGFAAVDIRRHPTLLGCIILGLALFGAACGAAEVGTVDTDATGPTVASDAPTPDSTSLPDAAEPQELANRLLAAYAGSDPSAWRGLVSADSRVFAPIEWSFLEDFDEDGVIAFADWQQFRIALHGAVEFRLEWECETVDEDEARCRIAGTDAFFEMAGAAPPPAYKMEKFDDGLWVGEEDAVPDATAEQEEQRGNAIEGRESAVAQYANWVAATYPSQYSAVFQSSEDDESVDWVTLPAAIAIHEQLIPEFLAGATAEESSAAGTGTITIVAQEWSGLEGHQVLAAVVPGDADYVRSAWPSPHDYDYFEPGFAGSVAWASIDGSPFTGELVVRDARPFAWFAGRTAALENESAQLEAGTYTVVLLASMKPGPIPNWIDDYMPGAPHMSFIEVRVAAGEVSRVVVPDFPPRPAIRFNRGPL